MLLRTISLAVFLILPTLLLAHGSHGNGIVAGFTHPIFGLDHNFAILGVGIYSFISGNKRWFLYPILFLIAMIGGGLLGIENESNIVIEKIIAFSILVMGLFIAYRFDSNFALSALIIAVFGSVHGFAHGAEMPVDNTALKYISGYSIGTIVLSSLGVLIGKLTYSLGMDAKHLSIFGGVIAGLGITFLLP